MFCGYYNGGGVVGWLQLGGGSERSERVVEAQAKALNILRASRAGYLRLSLVLGKANALNSPGLLYQAWIFTAFALEKD
jgi:hypothetical protein